MSCIDDSTINIVIVIIIIIIILETRRRRGDLIEAFKIMTDGENLDKNQFFQLSTSGHGLCGHSLTLAVSRCLDISLVVLGMVLVLVLKLYLSTFSGTGTGTGTCIGFGGSHFRV